MAALYDIAGDIEGKIVAADHMDTSMYGGFVAQEARRVFLHPERTPPCAREYG